MPGLIANNIESLGGSIKPIKNIVAKVNSISDLLNIDTSKLDDKEQFHVLGFHEPNDGGGGIFYWDANEDRSNHNGGTIISPDAIFPSDWSDTNQQETWFTASGTGNGCWKRVVGDYVTPEMFGAKGDGVTDDTRAVQKSFSLVSHLFLNNDSVYLISDEINIPSNAHILSSGGTLYHNSSSNRMFVASSLSGSIFKGFKVRCGSESILRSILYVENESSDVIIEDIDVDWSNADGTSSTYKYGIDFASKITNLRISNCKFQNGWLDTTYNASNAPDDPGNNVTRVISIYRGENVTIVYNYFENNFSCIYADSVTDLSIKHNTVRDTADTAIFDRCTAGVTYRKNVSHNKLYNIGKSAIKILDANNLNSKGHYGIVSNNIIENFGLYLDAPAIMCRNYYDYGGTNSYMKAPKDERAAGLEVVNNIIYQNVSSASGSGDIKWLSVTNVQGVVIKNNNVYLDSTITAVQTIAQWCGDVLIEGNRCYHPGAQAKIYTCDDSVVIRGNVFTMSDYFSFDKQYDLVIFTNNFVINKNTSPENRYGIGYDSNNSYGEALIANNVFVTELPVEDDNVTTSINIIRTPSEGSPILCTDNIIKFMGQGSVTGQYIGKGDGSRTKFLLPNRPVVSDSETIYIDGTETTAYSIDYQTGLVTFDSAPASGATITADYSFEKVVKTQVMMFGDILHARYYGDIKGVARYDEETSEIKFIETNIRNDVNSINIS